MSDSERQRWSDDVKRVKDELDFHAVMKHTGWVVFSLADGSPLDHIAYENWHAAVRAAKWNRDNYMYVEIQPDGAPYREAAAILDYARKLSDAGYRIPSPDWEAGPLASTMPYQAHDKRRMLAQLVSGKPLPGDHSNLPSAFRKDSL